MVSRETVRTPRQVFGAMLRYYRDRAGLTRPELARQIRKSESLIHATDGALRLLRDEIGDGLGYQAYPAWFQDWTHKEAEAATLRFFQPLIVPGLLQTEGYARAIFSTRFRITDDEVEELVSARMKRQEILRRDNPPAIWLILDEMALQRPIGGPNVMSHQLRRLVEMARQPHVVIEIIPASTGAYEGLAGAFTIADFDDAPSVGHQEGALRGQPVEEREDVATLDLTWATLRSDALPRAASLALLEEAAKSWTSPAT
jgi:hypothetical protein